MKIFHIALIADGRSPTTKSWIHLMQECHLEVSLISSFPCEKINGLKHLEVFPIAFSQIKDQNENQETNHLLRKKVKTSINLLIKKYTKLFLKTRYYFGPISVFLKRKKFNDLLERIKPDIIHALRIPYEGMLSQYTPTHIPVVISTWGNDLTLHALQSQLMKKHTRASLSRTNGLLSDTLRDTLLATKWGLKKGIPTLVIPGSGGLDKKLIDTAISEPLTSRWMNIPDDTIWIVNARGFRPEYVHNQYFFEAIPMVLEEFESISFICPDLYQYKDYFTIDRKIFDKNLFLLQKLDQKTLWKLFKRCAIFVSPSSHDGTPNSFLEALCCGCFPVMGDIDSIREWIVPGENGLLVDPKDPISIANGIISALNNPKLLISAKVINQSLINDRALFESNKSKLIRFYQTLM